MNASEENIKAVFDGLAHVYESKLETFTYFGAAHIARVFSQYAQATGRSQQLDLLDLGCGTGLCGKQLKPFARTLEGVDLSPKSLEVAGKLGIYDQLFAASAHAFFEEQPDKTYDVIASAGMFVYLSQLHDVIDNCCRHLRSKGTLLFTVDRHEDNSVDILSSPRSGLMFTYSQNYLERTLTSAGFQVVTLEKVDDRLNWQNRAPVPAFVVLAVRQDLK